MTQLQKHMLSDMKWYDWLTGRVAAVGRAGFTIVKYAI